jgi:hypothetical protein
VNAPNKPSVSVAKICNTFMKDPQKEIYLILSASESGKFTHQKI